MSPTVTFARSLADDPGLRPTHDQNPPVDYRVVGERRFHDVVGEWIEDQITPRNGTNHATDAELGDGYGSAIPTVAPGLKRIEGWRELGARENLTATTSVDHSGFGEVEVALTSLGQDRTRPAFGTGE